MWRIFNTEKNASIYALAVWLRMLRQRAEQGDGTLLNVSTRLKERIVDEWPDNDVTLTSFLNSLSDAQFANLITRLNNLPWLGRKHSGVLTEEGQSNRWSIPQQTLSGQWAVNAAPWDLNAVPEPVWPPSIGL